MLLSKSWHAFFMADSFFWRWMCMRLAEEAGLYLPDTDQGLPGPCPSWGHLFRELWTDINRVKSAPSLKSRERYSLQVCVRFRPDRADANTASRGSQVVLPLHQKIQLAKARRGGAGQCSTAQALRDVWADTRRNTGKSSSGDDGGGVDPWATAFLPAVTDDSCGNSAPGEGKGGAVGGPSEAAGASNKDEGCGAAEDGDANASTRAAPTQGEGQEKHAGEGIGMEAGKGKEKEGGEGAGKVMDEAAAMGHFHACVLSLDEATGAVLTVSPGCGLREFVFDRVFGERSMQGDVYQQSARRVVMDFVNGNSGCLLVYGQTGSGKTHTIFGPDAVFAASTQAASRGSSYQPGNGEEGIVPRACREVLAALEARRARGTLAHATLTVSYVEIYGNEVSDLLRGGTPVGQSRVAGQRYVLDGNIATEIKDVEQVEEILRVGEQQKRRAATAMNERSTRAHTVFMLRLVQDASWQRGWAAAGDDGTGGGAGGRGGDESPADALLAAAGAQGGDELTSTLMLVDLGGAEQMKKSLADAGTIAAGAATWQDYYARRQRLQEAQYINSGLFALKKCIDALNARARKARRATASAGKGNRTGTREGNHTGAAGSAQRAEGEAAGQIRGGGEQGGSDVAAMTQRLSATRLASTSSAAPAGVLAAEGSLANEEGSGDSESDGGLNPDSFLGGDAEAREDGDAEAEAEARDPFVWQRPDGAGPPPPQKPALAYVPYQDSKLTMLLSTSLSGECRSVVLVTASLMQCNAGETVQALRFGERCSSVKHVGGDGRAAMEAMAGLLRGLAVRIAECEQEIKSKERWETVRVRRLDEVSGEWEVVSTSMLVGAEKERERLEALLKRRRELLGIE
eukprot:jgi/Mesvir1/2264/Mv19309-RA.2